MPTRQKLLTVTRSPYTQSLGMYRPSSIWAWAFLITTTSQSVFIIVIQSLLLYGMNTRLRSLAVDDDTDMAYAKQQAMRVAPTYLTVMIMGSLYHPLIAWDALRIQNVVQTISSCLFSIALVGYSLFQLLQVHNAVAEIQSFQPQFQGFSVTETSLMIALPGMVAITTLALCLIAWKLAVLFAWDNYVQLSADIVIKRSLMMLQLYVTILKFDLFFFLGFSTQFLTTVGTPDGTLVGKTEFYLTAMAIPFAFALVVLAAYVATREGAKSHACIIATYFIAMAYFMFKLRQVFNHDTATAYRQARVMLTTFGVITMLLLIATIILAFKCKTNFGKGLKEKLQKASSANRDRGVAVKRMSLW